MININNFPAGFKRLIEYANRPLHPQVLDALTKIWENGDLKTVLEMTLNDDSSLEALAKKSSRHLNGFDRYILWQPGEKVQEPALRIHFWEEINKGGGPHIHNWDFASICLFGQVYQETYTETAGPGDLPVWRYIPQVLPGVGHNKVFDRQLDLTCLKKESISAGQPYSFNHKGIHRLGCQLSPSATLVLQGHFVNPIQIIYELKPVDSQELHFRPPHFSKEYVYEKIKFIYQHLPN